MDTILQRVAMLCVVGGGGEGRQTLTPKAKYGTDMPQHRTSRKSPPHPRPCDFPGAGGGVGGVGGGGGGGDGDGGDGGGGCGGDGGDGGEGGGLPPAQLTCSAVILWLWPRQGSPTAADSPLPATHVAEWHVISHAAFPVHAVFAKSDKEIEQFVCG